MAFMILYEEDEGFERIIRAWRTALEIPQELTTEESLERQAEAYGVRVWAGRLPAVAEEVIRGLLLSGLRGGSYPVAAQPGPALVEVLRQRAG